MLYKRAEEAVRLRYGHYASCSKLHPLKIFDVCDCLVASMIKEEKELREYLYNVDGANFAHFDIVDPSPGTFRSVLETVKLITSGDVALEEYFD